MAVNIRGKNFLKLLDYSPEEIRYLLDLSKNFKDMKRAGIPHKYLEGKNIVLLFEKTSTRTRCSFEVAGIPGSGKQPDGKEGEYRRYGESPGEDVRRNRIPGLQSGIGGTAC